MISASEFMEMIGADIDDTAIAGRPIRAWVAEEAAGKVRLSMQAGSTPGQQWHARLAGDAFAVGTEVLALRLDERNLIVLGAIKSEV